MSEQPVSRQPVSEQASRGAELLRFIQVMHRLRRECPWDARQTHRSLVTHLIEETGELVDAIEGGCQDDVVEELGDLLLQVYFHAEIGAQEGRFTIDDVACGIADKLIARHPYIWGDAEVPDDLGATWEARKRAHKQRSSALDGIAGSLPTLARATKVVSRTRNHRVAVDLATEPITAEEVGEQIMALVQRAQASGVDADQATRDALRVLEDRVRQAEG